MYRSILVPLDGSPTGEQVLPFAVHIARRSGATLYLAHVYVPYTPDPIYIDGTAVIDDRLQSLGREQAETYVSRVRAQLVGETAIPVAASVLDTPGGAGGAGAVAQALAERAAVTRADLVLMATHGRSGPARFWLGSVADTLIRLVSAPLLLMRRPSSTVEPRAIPPVRHILIPLDGSPLAEQVLGHALALGKLAGARYTLLHAVNPHIFVRYSPIADAAGDGPEAVLQRRRAAERYLDTLAEQLRGAGHRVNTQVVVSSEPAAAILDRADDSDIDLVAIATRGRSGLVRLLIGSVADKVLRGAEVPILVYHPEDASDRGREAW